MKKIVISEESSPSFSFSSSARSIAFARVFTGFAGLNPLAVSLPILALDEVALDEVALDAVAVAFDAVASSAGS